MSTNNKATYSSPVSRIGDRIRRIRTEKGMSQAELGAIIGLNADRIQKYENGARSPKADTLKQIASALGVSILALTDPNTASHIGAMYAFFELEEKFNMTVARGPENKDKNPTMTLSVSSADPMYYYMQEWLEKYEKTTLQLEAASSAEEKKTILKAYREWKWNYSFDNSTYEKTMQKARLKNEIEKLQKEYDSLCDTDEA